MPIRYVDREYLDPLIEPISVQPYYPNLAHEYYEHDRECNNSNEPYVTYPPKPDSLMLVGPIPLRLPQPLQPQAYQQRQLSATVPHELKCFECDGDHFARDCPNKQGQANRSRMIHLETFCDGCGFEHVPKDCPKRPKEAVNARPSRTTLNYIEVKHSP